MGEEAAARKFDRLRKLRKGVNYYGDDVGKDEALAAAKIIMGLLTWLRKKYLSKEDLSRLQMNSTFMKMNR